MGVLIMSESIEKKEPICSRCQRERTPKTDYSTEPDWLINKYRILCPICKEEYESVKNGSLL